MDIFTNEGTAERIGQRHQAINKSFVKGGKATAIAALATASLIQKILDRFKQKGDKQKPGLVEIKIDNKLVYKGIAGQKPEIDKLTPEHKAILDSIVSRPEPSFEKDFEIFVDGKPVYKSEKGVEKINELGSPSNQKSPPHEIKSLSALISHQEIKNLSALISSKSILENGKTNSYENQDYRIERGSKGLGITAKDGRGEIARINSSGLIMGLATTKDTAALREIANQIEQQNEVGNKSSQTQLPSKGENQLSENQSAQKPRTQLAPMSANQESEELER